MTYDVIHEFAAENVKYLELRSTPREVTATGMTKSSYVEAVLRAIEVCSKENDLDIVVKFLLAIDRRNGVDVAKETVELAEKYHRSSGGIVVGVDLSGDPKVL
jgi:adenosine deaminase